MKFMCVALIAGNTFLFSVPAMAQETTPVSSYAMGATSCRALGPALADVTGYTGAALINAAQAGVSASALDYKKVEDSWMVVTLNAAKANLPIGALMSSEISDPTVAALTSEIAQEATAEIVVAKELSTLSLNYEREDNRVKSRRRRLLGIGLPLLLLSPIAGAGFIRGASGATQTTSQTSGTINGQAVELTTTTYDYSLANAIGAFQAQTQQNRKEALDLYTPQIINLGYVLPPLAKKWISACRSAGSL